MIPTAIAALDSASDTTASTAARNTAVALSTVATPANRAKPASLPEFRNSGIILHKEEPDMARRRLQKNGHLYKENGWWKLRWREDVVAADGTVRRARMSTVIARCEGPGALTQRKAQREAYDRVLSKVNQAELVPQSLMKLKDFVEKRFTPEHVLSLKPGGQVHYRVNLPHVIKDLGELSLREVKPHHVQQLCLALLNKTYTVGKDRQRRIKDPETGQYKVVIEKRAREMPYSVQTALHLKNVASAIFEHAKAVGMYSGENPAEHVRLPEIRRKDKHALTLDQMNLLLQTLPTPARELAYLAVLTSMNIAELCGLQWKQVNLSEAWTIVDGESLPPMAIAVRRQWSTRKIEGQKGGAYHTLKAGSRRRNLPVDPEMAKVLRMVAARAKFAGPEDPVFASTSGRPVDTHNLFNRVLKPTGIKLGMPWLGWHTFRHTHATWIRQHAASPADQMAMLGHADIRMTMHYGHEDLARRRLMIEKLSAQLVEKMPEATAVAAIQ